MAFGKEIRRLRDGVKISAQILADAIGIDAEKLRKWEQRDSDPSYEDKLIIEKYFGTTLDNLMKMDKLPKLKEESYTEKRRKLKNNKENTLTYYDIGAAAGPVGDILPVNKTEGKIYINDLFRNTQFAVRISGNSMTPGYPPGAIVGIKEIQDKQISPGTVYVVEKGNELWIKRLFYKDDKQETGRFELISDNTMRFERGSRKGQLFYPAFHVGIDEVRVFKVTGIFKSNDLTVV